jgi:hypothetical protein
MNTTIDDSSDTAEEREICKTTVIMRPAKRDPVWLRYMWNTPEFNDFMASFNAYDGRKAACNTYLRVSDSDRSYYLPDNIPANTNELLTRGPNHPDYNRTMALYRRLIKCETIDEDIRVINVKMDWKKSGVTPPTLLGTLVMVVRHVKPGIHCNLHATVFAQQYTDDKEPVQGRALFVMQISK